MKEIRLLFTGVGRRIELVQAFRDAALRLNIALKIYGVDLSGTAPALAYCDYTRKVCGMKEKQYINELIELCEKDKIDILIPTIDTDLLVLSKNAHLFKNTRVLISSSDKIEICRDKNKTSDFFELCGCYAPKTVNDWKLYNGEYPCFIKPKDGSSSVNAFKIENEEELELHAQQIDDYIVQPFIEGTEYTVDVLCDFNGNPIFITPRIRLQVRAGEVLKTQISMDEAIIDEAKLIISKFKPIGPITLQLIRQNITNKDYFIEINPRFGGGAPLSMKAGARSADAILSLLLNRTLENELIENGAVYSRFDQSVCIKNGDKQLIKGVVFDLDDTLFNEKEYVKSGFKAVSNYLHKEEAYDKLCEYFEVGKPAIDEYLKEIGKIDVKPECLEVYRTHFPELTLKKEIRELLLDIKSRGIKLGVITDGRSIAQRNKIKALGLDKIIDDIIVTDELGGEQFRKPCDISFRIMQRKWMLPFEQMVYIGDNVNKDFQAPKQLGMKWFLLKNSDSLYQNDFCECEGCTLTDTIYKILKNNTV